MSNPFEIGDMVKLSRAAIGSRAFKDFPSSNLRVSEVIPSENRHPEGPDFHIRVTHSDWPGWISQAIAASWLELA